MTYWLQQPLQVNVDGPLGQSSTSFARPFVRIGSDPDSDVALQSEGLSRRAVYIHATPHGIFAVRLQGARRRSSVLSGEWLAADDQLQVGPFRLTVSTPETPDLGFPDCSLLDEDDQPSCRSHFELFCRDKLVGLKSFAAGLIFIGRAPQCSLQLKGQNVSKFHCVLYREDDRLWCVDLLSSNGTLLHGSPIVAEELQPADVLDIGEFSLVYKGCQRSPVGLLADAPSVALSVSMHATVTEPTPCETILTADEFDSSRALLSQVESELTAARALNEQNELLRSELQAALKALALQKDEVRLEFERLAAEREALELERRNLEKAHQAGSQTIVELPSDPIPIPVEVESTAPAAAEVALIVAHATAEIPDSPAETNEPVTAVLQTQEPVPNEDVEVALANGHEVELIVATPPTEIPELPAQASEPVAAAPQIQELPVPSEDLEVALAKTEEVESIAAIPPAEVRDLPAETSEPVAAIPQIQERPAPSPDWEVALAKKKERDDLATLVLDRLEEPALARRRAILLWTSISLTLITAAALSWLIYLKMFANGEI